MALCLSKVPRDRLQRVHADLVRVVEHLGADIEAGLRALEHALRRKLA